MSDEEPLFPPLHVFQPPPPPLDEYDYAGMLELMVEVQDGKPTRELVNVIMDMMVGEPYHRAAAPQIRHGEAVYLLFGLLAASPTQLQADIFTTFTTLVGRSMRNQAAACRLGVLAYLMDRLPASESLAEVVLRDKIMDLIHILGRYSITVVELKAFLRLVKSVPGPPLPESATPPVHAAAASLLASIPPGAPAPQNPALISPTPTQHNTLDAESRVTSPNLSVASTATSGRRRASRAKSAQTLMRVRTRKSRAGSTSAPPKALIPYTAIPASSPAPSSSSSSSSIRWVRPDRSPSLLKLLRQMAPGSGPSVFFDFPPTSKGLSIPQLDKWPAGGWAFSTWIRFETFPTPSPNSPTTGSSTSSYAQPEHWTEAPRVWSFITESGVGMELVISPTGQHLTLLRHSNGSNLAAAQFAYIFSPGIWYHIAISHTKHRLSRSELTLWVNGTGAQTMALKYPNIKEPLIHARIGTHIRPTPQSSKPLPTQEPKQGAFSRAFGRKAPSAPTSPTSPQGAPAPASPDPVRPPAPFNGQLGAVFFFADPIEPQVASALATLGPNYMSAFLSSDDGAGSPDPAIAALFQGKLSSSLFLTYNPKACRGDSVFDATPEAHAKLRRRGAATKLEGVSIVRTHSLQDAVQGVGGVKVLFPLLAQLDQPLASGLSSSEQETDDAMCTLLVRVIADLLRGSYSNQYTLYQENGFMVLAHLLSQASPSHLSPDVVDALAALLKEITHFAPLHDAFHKHILWNFKLWIYTSVETQKALLNLLSSLVETNPGRFRSLIGVRGILDILRHYYWINPEPPYTLCVDPHVHPVTGRLHSRPSLTSDLRWFRATLLKILRRVVAAKPQTTQATPSTPTTPGGSAIPKTPGLQPRELRHIFAHVTHCKDGDQLSDVLQLLLVLWADVGGYLPDVLAAAGGLLAIFNLVDHPTEFVRVLAIKLLARAYSLVRGRRASRLLPSGTFFTLAPRLSVFPFTEATYSALLELLTQNVSNHVISQRTALDGTQTFYHQGVLASIFRLTLNSDNRTSLQLLLQDFALMLEHGGDANREFFLSAVGWEGWLLSVIAMVDAQSSDATAPLPTSPDAKSPLGLPHAGVSQQTGVVFDLVITIFRTLFRYFVYLPTGNKILEQIQGYVDLFGEQGLIDPVAFNRALYTGFLSTAASELFRVQKERSAAAAAAADAVAASQDPSYSPEEVEAMAAAVPKITKQEDERYNQLRTTIMALLSLMEEFLFYSPDSLDGSSTPSAISPAVANSVSTSRPAQVAKGSSVSSALLSVKGTLSKIGRGVAPGSLLRRISSAATTNEPVADASDDDDDDSSASEAPSGKGRGSGGKPPVAPRVSVTSGRSKSTLSASSIDVGPLRDRRGRWMDFDLVQRMLVVLDALVLDATDLDSLQRSSLMSIFQSDKEEDLLRLTVRLVFNTLKEVSSRMSPEQAAAARRRVTDLRSVITLYSQNSGPEAITPASAPMYRFLEVTLSQRDSFLKEKDVHVRANRDRLKKVLRRDIDKGSSGAQTRVAAITSLLSWFLAQSIEAQDESVPKALLPLLRLILRTHDRQLGPRLVNSRGKTVLNPDNPALADNAAVDEWARLSQTEDWKHALKAFQDKTNGKTRDAEVAMKARIISGRAQAATAAHSMLKKAHGVELNDEAKVREAGSALYMELNEEEATHQMGQSIVREVHVRRAARLWRNVWRTLTRDRGAFGASNADWVSESSARKLAKPTISIAMLRGEKDDEESKIITTKEPPTMDPNGHVRPGPPPPLYRETGMRWTLDLTEDASRCRRKLRPNYHFDPHHRAALDSNSRSRRSTMTSTRSRKQRTSTPKADPTPPPTNAVVAEDGSGLVDETQLVRVRSADLNKNLAESDDELSTTTTTTSAATGDKDAKGLSINTAPEGSTPKGASAVKVSVTAPSPVVSPEQHGPETPASAMSTDDDADDITGISTTTMTDAALSEGVPEMDEDLGEWAMVDSAALRGAGSAPSLAVRVLAEDGEKGVVSAAVTLITPLANIPGQLEVTNRKVYFFVDRVELELQRERGESSASPLPPKDRSWDLGSLTALYHRRYLLRHKALELRFDDSNCWLFHFQSRSLRNKVFSQMIEHHPSSQNVQFSSHSPADLFGKAASVTEAWRRREMSNFDYLMHLNTLAGRSYNDLTQYPVFPWVLTDYTSDTIDLTDPSVYRDLSKPVGALNPKRLAHFESRYREWDDPEIPKFHYGSHYLSSGAVLYYLMRLEPFTSLFVNFQGGKFDHADRMFDSLAGTWASVMTSTSDVKELIPELFYCPEALVNHNRFRFGRRSDGRRVDHVVLPPWADSPEEFVRIHRAALESEYVSANLHKWIDLIFGCKQRGEAAVQAQNVFYYLTYEGAVDLDTIEDPLLRKATETQINAFGQTPSQLLTKPHPSRMSGQELAAFRESSEVPAPPPEVGLERMANPLVRVRISEGPVVYLAARNDHLLTVGSRGEIGRHGWDPRAPALGLPFTLSIDKYLGSTKLGQNILLASQYSFGNLPGSNWLFTSGHWDYSVKVVKLSDPSHTLQSVSHHKDVTSCIALSEDGKTLVSAGVDCLVFVWDVVPEGTMVKGQGRIWAGKVDKLPLSSQGPRALLWGHDGPVTCLAVSASLDVVLSGAKDGCVIVHTLRSGTYVRSLYHSPNSCVNTVSLAGESGLVVSTTSGPCALWVHTLNGVLIGHLEFGKRDVARSLVTTEDGLYLLIGFAGPEPRVEVRAVHRPWVLVHTYRWPVGEGGEDNSVSSMTLTTDERFLTVGLMSGFLVVFGTGFDAWKTEHILPPLGSSNRDVSGRPRVRGLTWEDTHVEVPEGSESDWGDEEEEEEEWWEEEEEEEEDGDASDGLDEPEADNDEAVQTEDDAGPVQGASDDAAPSGSDVEDGSDEVGPELNRTIELPPAVNVGSGTGVVDSALAASVPEGSYSLLVSRQAAGAVEMMGAVASPDSEHSPAVEELDGSGAGDEEEESDQGEGEGEGEGDKS